MYLNIYLTPRNNRLDELNIAERTIDGREVQEWMSLLLNSDGQNRLCIMIFWWKRGSEINQPLAEFLKVRTEFAKQTVDRREVRKGIIFELISGGHGFEWRTIEAREIPKGLIF